MLDLATRRKHCEDTIRRSASITHSTPSATLSSTFIPTQLPPISASSAKSPNLHLRPIEVLPTDTFLTARNILATQPSARNNKLAVLNLASDAEVAGGWRHTISFTQEEALCYSSTLYSTLNVSWYPWPNTGEGCVAGICSPAVVVFKDTLDNGLKDLRKEERVVVSVITVAAPRLPELTPDGEAFADDATLAELREKIRLVLRIAAGDGKTWVVLGALGCGAYGCPPGLVARVMKGVLAEKEFGGWFEGVVFAVFAAGSVGRRNFEIFREVFEG